MDQLAAAGYNVDRVQPPFDVEDAWRVYGSILGGEAGSTLPGALRMFAGLAGRFTHRDSPMIRATQRGMASSLPGYLDALVRRDEFVAATEKFLEPDAAWLCPVACGPAFTHQRPAPYLRAAEPVAVGAARVSYWSYALGYASPLNLTASPVVVLPLARNADGLPIGVQLVGRRWHDRELLEFAKHVSAISGPFQPPPGY
jgi:amidase